MKQFNRIFLPELDFDLNSETGQDGRKYITPEGNKWPSVTTILKNYNNLNLLDIRFNVRMELHQEKVWIFIPVIQLLHQMIKTMRIIHTIKDIWLPQQISIVLTKCYSRHSHTLTVLYNKKI